jgi:hypothetical protein
MSAERELTHVWALNLAGFQVCAGKLGCIFRQLQQGRPLSMDEIEREEKNAATEVLEVYETLHMDTFSQ